MKTFDSRNNDGAALILISVALAASGLLGSAMLASLTSARYQRGYFDIGNRSLYAAESGRAYVYAQRGADQAYVPSGTYALESGEQFILESENNGTNLTVTVTGVAHPGTHRESHHAIAFPLSLPGGGAPPQPFFDFYGSELVTQAAGAVRVSGLGVAIMRDGASYTGNTRIEVAYIYAGDDVTLSGTSRLGSSTEPTLVYVDGNVTLGGSSAIYGDLYLTGTFSGDLSRVFGTVYFGFDEDDLPDFVRFAREDSLRPALRAPDQWYYDRGYSANPAWGNGMRVFTRDDYTSANDRPSAANVVIVSAGDITLNMGGAPGILLSGIVFAPSGKVTLNGKGFAGTVIARDGLFTTQGNTDVTFQDMSTFLDSPDDYPLVLQ